MMVDWSGGQSTPAGKATRFFGGMSKRSPSWRSHRKRFLLPRKLKRCPRKATARSGNQHALTSQCIVFESEKSFPVGRVIVPIVEKRTLL